jgi:hypothetical protein
MPRVRPLEVKALRPLLERDWEQEDDLIEALILALDEVRASRTSYVGIIQIGQITLGVGPYPGRRSAENALSRHPGMSMATGAAIASIETPEGFDRMMKELDKKPNAA